MASAVNYRNAGTVEYIYDRERDEFYFLEMNTRLQVGHAVTEEVYAVDLVELMVRLAANELPRLPTDLHAQGHAIQARIYAEDPFKNFQPAAGLISHVHFPERDRLRVDHWIQSGMEISPLFDPLLAKVVVTAGQRNDVRKALIDVLGDIELYGVETNLDYISEILKTNIFTRGDIHTGYLSCFDYRPGTIDVISPGTMTTIQDYPGRNGYWDVGVPPSGPFDQYAFRFGNRLLDNPERAAGLEITSNGPTLRFNCETQAVLTGAVMDVTLNDEYIEFNRVFAISAGDKLKIADAKSAGVRSYLLVKGGIECPDYLGSKSTFTLGRFGGHVGRALGSGDVLHIAASDVNIPNMACPEEIKPVISNRWQLRVVYGPHGAPDFFTEEDIEVFFPPLGRSIIIRAAPAFV